MQQTDRFLNFDRCHDTSSSRKLRVRLPELGRHLDVISSRTSTGEIHSAFKIWNKTWKVMVVFDVGLTICVMLSFWNVIDV